MSGNHIQCSFLSLLFIALSLFFYTGNVCATEKYADRTGAECSFCHVDSLGGGELTDYGRGYLLSLGTGTTESRAAEKPFQRIIRLLFLYIHIVTGFLWFGTILYVHLVLKPAYASKGLPRGEVKVGLASMAVMAVSGIVLTYYRIPSPGLLISSRFGILLLAKIVIFLIMAVSALYVVFFIGPRLRTKKKVSQVYSGEITDAELENYDGRDGRPAYFAYNGRVYDVSGSRFWKGGSHMARHQAGVDLTDMLSQAPHEEDKILAMPEVGLLVAAESPDQESPHKNIFFVMAYMNLGLVFIVSLILALWRW